MKTLTCIILCLVAWAATPAFGQDAKPQAAKIAPPTFTKFDLDFPGGTPGELVAAIEKATGRPLNAIVPVADADVKLPPLKMKNVYAAQLFAALEAASKGTEAISDGRGAATYSNVSFGFHTPDIESDDAVWFFFNYGPPNQPKSSRFFLLTPYLDQGLTVDDITTAIQTSWKMLGISPTPTLSFHQETKLLIAVGDPTQLQSIDDLLSVLKAPKPATSKGIETLGGDTH